MAEKNFWADNQKVKFVVFLIFALLVGVSLVSWTVTNFIIAKEELKKLAYSINIEGDGKVTAIPNVAEVSVSVISDALTPDKAATGNINKVNKITESLKSSGIDEKDIKTSGYYLNPKYQYKNGKSEIVGYTQSQTLLVKIRKFGSVGDVIKGAIDAGANQVGDLSFNIDDPEAYKAQAREMAIDNAKQKAEDMAKAAGIRLGKIINIVEGSASVPMPMKYYYRDVGLGGGAVPTPSIEQGSQEVSVSVTVTFALK